MSHEDFLKKSKAIMPTNSRFDYSIYENMVKNDHKNYLSFEAPAGIWVQNPDSVSIYSIPFSIHEIKVVIIFLAI